MKRLEAGGHTLNSHGDLGRFHSVGAPADLTYVDSPASSSTRTRLNRIIAPAHLLIGFPTRYVERGWSDSMRALPDLEHREARSKANQRVRHGHYRSTADGQPRRRSIQALERGAVRRESSAKGPGSMGSSMSPGTWSRPKSSLPGGSARAFALFQAKATGPAKQRPATLHHAARRIRRDSCPCCWRFADYEAFYFYRPAIVAQRFDFSRWERSRRIAIRPRRTAAGLYAG